MINIKSLLIGTIILWCLLSCSDPEENGIMAITSPNELNMHNAYSPGDSIVFSIERTGRPFKFLDISLQRLKARSSEIITQSDEVVAVHHFETLVPENRIKDNAYTFRIKIPDEVDVTPEGYYEELRLSEEGRSTSSYAVWLWKFKNNEDIPKLTLHSPSSEIELINHYTIGDSINIEFLFSGESVELFRGQRVDRYNDLNEWVANHELEILSTVEQGTEGDLLTIKTKLDQSITPTPKGYNEYLSFNVRTEENTLRSYSFNLGAFDSE